MGGADRTFLELGAEVGRGQKFPGERNKNGSGAGAVFAHVGGDVGVAQELAGRCRLPAGPRPGAGRKSAMSAASRARDILGQAATWLADFVWKWAPMAIRSTNFKFQGEYFQRREKGSLACADENASGNALQRSRRQLPAAPVRQVCPGRLSIDSPQWRAGYRYDRLASGSPHIERVWRPASTSPAPCWIVTTPPATA